MALVKSTFLEKLGGVVVVLFPEEPVVSIVVVMVSKSTLPLNIVSTELTSPFEYCIFLINTNFHGETFSDATFYGAIFNKVGNFGGVKFNNGVSFNSAK
jgi:hypothetical protein